MSKIEPLGVKRVEAIHYYVHDLERSRRFYIDKFDFREIGVSSKESDEKGKQSLVAFEGGDMVVMCSAPLGEGGRAWRFLQKHPDGVGTVVFEVEDVKKTFALLESRGGTPIQDIQWFDSETGKLGYFSIATPFGDSTFRFVERQGETPLFPGFVEHSEAVGGKNKYSFSHIDHITSNFQTMSPALLWMEHVMGFEKYWDVEFHTSDVDSEQQSGSGLRSAVYWDRQSGVKFANNEPWRPFFKNSQINIFNEDHRGDGIQHVALAVDNIVNSVKSMRDAGVEFMPTPKTYYQMLPKRLNDIGVNAIEESIDLLEDLQILVDGEKDKSYMLQIFLKDSAALYSEAAAGPFFYEIIQRKGDLGFGAGNFRALFESIEREQTNAS